MSESLLPHGTVVYQAPLPMGFSMEGYWSGLPFLSPGDIPHPGGEPGFPALQADVLPSGPPRKNLLHSNRDGKTLNHNFKKKL